MNGQKAFSTPNPQALPSDSILLTIFRRSLAALAIASVAATCVAGSSAAAGPAKRVSGRILVKAKPAVPEAVKQAIFAGYGAHQHGAISQIDVRILTVPEQRFERALTLLKQNRNIEWAEPDYILEPALLPNDTYYSLEWHLPKIQAPEAWDITTGVPGVIIAILDSGIDAAHPDLAGQLVPGWNFYDNNADTTDVTGHGTAVAGQACASSNNGIGIASPAWACKIMPIRIADLYGYTSDSMIAAGLTYAADHGAQVANASFTISGSSATLSSAAAYLQSKGGVFTGSAGNDGTFDSSPDDPYILRISATDSSDNIASFSSTGNNIDLCAPGVNIVTTTRGGGYGYGTGTSASAPLVAGVAALMISANPNLTGSQVQTLLKQSADDLGPTGWDSAYGWGRLNAYNAVLAAISAGPADNTPPSVQVTSPVNGATLSGTTNVNVAASDNVGVSTVECYLNGTLVGSSACATASFSWNTSSYPNGAYTIQSKAYDAAGNVGSSVLVTVSVQNSVPDTTPPTVRITSPTGGTITGKTTPVSVVATDNVGVTRVDLLVDGKKYATSTSATPTFTWNTSKLARGSHTLQAVAYDAAGNSARSSVVTVTK